MGECQTDLQLAIDELPSHLAERSRLRTSGHPNQRGKRVLYWTHHALRSDENPALDVAKHLAHRLQLPLLVYQGLSEDYRFANDRHHTFILEAARELQESYAKLGITFAFHLDRRTARLPRLAALALSSAVVVTEDFPIEATQHWTERLAASRVPAVVLVDTACVVPMQLVGKAYDRAFAFREATAEHYRRRVDLSWPAATPNVQSDTTEPFASLQLATLSLPELVAECEIDHSIGPVSDTRGGATAGYARWEAFRSDGLRSYAKRRNQIELAGVSRMSAYLHYGMVSPFRLAREASADKATKFLDELLIWRELAYAFCYYRRELESESSLPAWAIATLKEHESDPRRVLSWETLARARTGERLWDAAQRSLLKHGELHNNVRMTWGKAVLAWSSNHLQTLERLVDLNHRYALDGRDPASYGGILWCLGQFDRPFFPEQPIFGRLRPRPMDQHAHRTDVAAYQRRVDRATANPLPRIAMIGTGLGGLMCSRILKDHGLPVHCFDKSHRAGGRSTSRKTEHGHHFDHGAQYFTIRDANLKRYLDSWILDGHVAQWHGRLVSIDEPGRFNDVSPLQRYVGKPMMESLSQHLAGELELQLNTQVDCVIRQDSGFRLLAKDARELGHYDIVLWNCPPAQTLNLLPSQCDWRERLAQVEMLPCWAVLIALDSRWNVPFDGAFVNQGKLSWIARDSSKPGRSLESDTWVLHSTVDWAKEHGNASQEQVAACLVQEAERVTGCGMPRPYFANAHRWLYSRPHESLPEPFLWDDNNWLGACGDWCGGPRIEGALKSGLSLAGRVLGALHAHRSTAIGPSELKQLSLFDEYQE